MSTLYEKIGKQKIEEAITKFYDQAFKDPIIGHFFFKKDQIDLTQKQIQFASLMLGSKEHSYKGKPLKEAHSALPIGLVHFNRRQRILAEVLQSLEIDEKLSKEWLEKEESLKPLIIRGSFAGCRF